MQHLKALHIGGLKNLLDFLSYSNGKRSVFQISNILNLEIKSCLEILKKLTKHDLIT